MKILFKTKFGSHLYGTDTPNSDLDFKGIYQASFEDIVFKRDKGSIVQSTGNYDSRNSKDDIDIEYKELREFLKDCMQGQTYALDMLFSSKDMWIEISPEWEYIIKYRQKLLSKNVQPYIGYCRQQAGKYGLKGSRLGELKRVMDYLEKYPEKETMEVAMKKFEEGEFAYFEELPVRKGSDQKSMFLNVLGKKFQFSIFVKQAMSSLRTMYEKYGERAELAMQNKGIDWKAISHAYRCCYQLIELAETHNLHFPLKEAKYLKKIKQGDALGINYSEIQDELYELMEKAIKAVEESTLPTNCHKEFWDDFIIKTYAKSLHI